MKTCTALAFLFATLTGALTAQMPDTPGAEHKKLTAHAGKWTAAMEYMGEDGKPATSKGMSVVKAGPGGLWVIDDFEGDFAGMPFVGHGTTGFDKTKGKYVGTWIDSMSSSQMLLEGSYDASGKVLTMTGMAMGMEGKPVQHRLVTTDKDANTRVFEMFMPGPDGKEMKMLTITYTRADKGAGNDADKAGDKGQQKGAEKTGK